MGSEKFGNILICTSFRYIYHETKAVQAVMVGSIVVVGSLTRCALLHTELWIKRRMSWTCNVVWISNLRFKSSKATKNICYRKDEE